MDVNEHERLSNITQRPKGSRGRDRMIVGFKTTYTISDYHHYGIKSRSGEVYSKQHYMIKFVSHLRQVGSLSVTCDRSVVCQSLATGR